MKNILSLIIILTSISCGHENKKPKRLMESHLEKTEMSASKIVDNNFIGEWGIYEHYANGTIINCNVCPKIEFTDSKYASLTLPSNEIESYEWSSLEDILKLKIVDKGSGQYLPNSEYRMKFNEHGKFFELILSISDKEQFTLRK